MSLAVIHFPKLLNSLFIVFIFVISFAVFSAPVISGLLAPLGYPWPYLVFSLFSLSVGLPLMLCSLPSEKHIVRMGATGLSNYRSNKALPQRRLQKK